MWKPKLNTRRWTRKFDRVGYAVRRMPRVVVEAPGHEQKVRAAFERGDDFELSPEAIEDCKQTLVEHVARIANTGGDNLHAAAVEIGEICLADLNGRIMDGSINGPPRSREWEQRKGNSINLLGLGDQGGHMADAIQYRLVR